MAQAPISFARARSANEEAFFDTVAQLLDEILMERTDQCSQSCVLLAMRTKGLAVDVIGEARRKLKEMEEANE